MQRVLHIFLVYLTKLICCYLSCFYHVQHVACEDDEYACPEICIPVGFQCDFWHDCRYGEDELGCGHEEKVDGKLRVFL